MSKTYQITLTPLDWYFFGGETTFGESGDSSNYYAKSNLLPQETALLGMLRFELLKANGLIPINSSERKEQADKLIGKSSFNYNDRNLPDSGFGAIQSISPVFILRENKDILYKTPKHHNQEISFQPGNVTFTKASEETKTPLINGFSSKNLPMESWLSIDDDKEYLEKDIFIHKTRIGITKMNKDRQDNNKDGFFKTKLCSLSADYSFVFYATLDTNILVGERLVNLGAERSMFNMSIQESEETIDKLFKKTTKKDGKLVFLSDSFVDSKILSLCQFAWVDTIPFRNLNRTTSVNKNYAALNKKEEKSNHYNLIKRGSVLFFSPSKANEIKELIDNNYLQHFGYNVYL